MFGSTYCEQLFSKINYTKSRLRSQLSDRHLNDILLLSISSIKPDIESLINAELHHPHFEVLVCHSGPQVLPKVSSGPRSEKFARPCSYMTAKYDANRSKKKAALIPLSQVTSTKHLHHPLQPLPFHPAYVFNHLEAARQGPYPRLPNGTSPVLHTSLQNGHILQTSKNNHSVLQVSGGNGSIDL
ncbi:hypothetical protein GWK47_041541 [Chionoecetes opilio]|uniref:Uncharacterized protein n=1 Tax=Chionoecetes opilio TaxID=41210 RepID=A0A8J5D0H0_CHIOP|nr:hypothetical protein GWK47_041541 [Chionoecetes opilio]